MEHGRGRLFSNFPLHPDLKPFEGVNITRINSRLDEEEWDQDRNRIWERWAKNFMGLTNSPYRYLQILIHVKFIAYGDIKTP